MFTSSFFTINRYTRLQAIFETFGKTFFQLSQGGHPQLIHQKFNQFGSMEYITIPMNHSFHFLPARIKLVHFEASKIGRR